MKTGFVGYQMIDRIQQHRRRPFNTALENGLRSLFILDAIFPAFRDLQRIVYYDYLAVHSSDIINGPTSLHPAVPHRSGEWLVRHKLVLDGLNLMFSKLDFIQF